MSAILLASLSALLLGVIFLGTWWFAGKVDNYSVVDVAWSLAFAPVALLYGLLGGGWEPRRWLVAGLVALWSLRLGVHLWTRVAAHHPREDARYAVLRESWEGRLRSAFLWFFLAQGLLVWLLMLPVLLVSRQASPGFHPLEIAGLATWALALIGEGIADAQLKRFKKSHPGRSQVCRAGLWRYSRHPNYFFQSLLWWGLFLLALPTPWGWTTIIAPLSMLYFLLRVTGIPLTERLSLEAKGDAYREYQATTSAFVPWFPHAKPKHPETSS